jgi:ribosomal protein L11 methylase PrmA
MCIIGKGGTEIGFGASVYDSSIVMSEFLQEPGDDSSSSIVAGKSVVELGCGPGLNSITATLARAAFVYCTDGDDASVELARENFAENILLEGTYKVYTFICIICSSSTFYKISSQDISY